MLIESKVIPLHMYSKKFNAFSSPKYVLQVFL